METSQTNSELSFTELVGSIKTVDAQLRDSSVRAVNAGLTLRNWCIGAYISAYNLRGNGRAAYGEHLFETISQTLKKTGMKRCDVRDLRRYVLFFQRYPQIYSILPDTIRQNAYLLPPAPVDDNNYYIGGIRETVSPEFVIPADKLVSTLSFSHICEILEIQSPLKRLFYETECIKGTWSVRELKRQIETNCFERTGLSKNKDALLRLANTGAETQTSDLIIRDPYVFEFLGLKSIDIMTESAFETALLEKLQDFLLELGHGFCFEARQKRILIGGEYSAVDLVFYHRILKCHVLVDLKMEGFTYAHVGQMNMYLSWFKENIMSEGDNPPVGIVLCPQKDDEIVKYATGGLSNEVFVSKYEAVLPDITELERFVIGETRTLREKQATYRKE